MSAEEVQLERRLGCHRALLLPQPWRCVSLLPPAGWDAERLRHSNRGHLHRHQAHALSRPAGPIPLQLLRQLARGRMPPQTLLQVL